jgi:hypothetical protein
MILGSGVAELANTGNRHDFRNLVRPRGNVDSVRASTVSGAEPFGISNDLNGFDKARTGRGKSVRLRFALGPASNDQGSAKIEGRLGADMLDAPPPIRPEKVIAKAVVFTLDQAFQPGSQAGPLRRINLDLEYRILHALAMVAAGLGDPPQTSRPAGFGGANIVGHKNHHGDPSSDWVPRNEVHFQIHGG